MSRPSSIRKRGAAGFTLAEILVAEAIFLILLLLVMQIIFGALQTVGAQKKQMDALDDARQSLDRLSLDWSSRVRRGDIAAVFTHQSASTSNAANAQISFLTEVPAYSGARHLAWVFYGVNNVTQVNQGSQTALTPGLVRGILGYNWSSGDSTGTANPLMTFPAQDPTTANTPTVEPLANTVFRFDYCYLLSTASPGKSPFTINNPTDTANPADTQVNLSSTNLVGVVVAVASLDQQSRQVLTQAQLVALGNDLPAVTDGQSPQALWTTAINNGTFAANAKVAGVPASVANAVRVFQRVLYVNE